MGNDKVIVKGKVRNVIAHWRRGSKAYNLDNEESDNDTIGVYIDSIEDKLKISENYQPYKDLHTDDHTMMELTKFIQTVLLKTNPQYLEHVYMPKENYFYVHPLFITMLEEFRRSGLLKTERQLKITKHMIKQDFKKVRRLLDENEVRKAFKVFYQNYRLHFLVKSFLNGEEVIVKHDDSSNVRNEVLKYKNVKVSVQELENKMDELETFWDQAKLSLFKDGLEFTDERDLNKIDELLIKYWLAFQDVDKVSVTFHSESENSKNVEFFYD